MSKHPIVVAFERWADSAQGRRCLGGSASGQYLRNRINAAFIAGWDEHDTYERYQRSKAKIVKGSP